jgi:putative protein-disulfide isomerase
LTSPVLWYFADPMCSWCWGFSPVIESVRETYRDRMAIALVLGGLRPGETEPMTTAARQDILQHWHHVHERTGQTFDFNNALPDGFIYDTEPASRAVVAIGTLNPTLIFPLFKAIQTAFYAEARDVTQIAVLTDLATRLGIDASHFLASFDSETTRNKTRAHFKHARQAGVSGFPTLILQRDAQLLPICTGCQPLVAVRDAIDAGLAG